MRLILTFLLLLSFNLRSQTLSFTNCDSTDRVQTFYVELNPGSTYNWSVTGGTIISENLNRITILFPNTESTFVISVIENNATGCPGEQRKLLVESLPCNEEVIWIPSAFTPNGDGLNDLWRIKELSYYPNCEVTIFDRYGQLIYYSKGYKNPWDGTKNGQPMTAGTYCYLIDTKKLKTIFKGFVVLLR